MPEEENKDTALKLRELELETHYKIKGLSDSFENIKEIFDNFKSYVDSTLNRMDERMEGMKMTLEQFMEKQEERNDRVWKRLNVITFLVMLQLFDVNVDIIGLASTALLRVF